MGAVFAARDRILGREVAIKCLPPALAGDATTRARFLREARAAATLRHPGVVQVYDVDPDARFLVMELVDGESLAVRIRRSRLTAAEARRLGAALLDTLAHSGVWLLRPLRTMGTLVRRIPNASSVQYVHVPRFFADARTQGGLVRDAVVVHGLSSPEQVLHGRTLFN
jgi:serine/threonine-protein kinase